MNAASFFMTRHFLGIYRVREFMAGQQFEGSDLIYILAYKENLINTYIILVLT